MNLIALFEHERLPEEPESNLTKAGRFGRTFDQITSMQHLSVARPGRCHAFTDAIQAR